MQSSKILWVTMLQQDRIKTMRKESENGEGYGKK